MLFWKHFRNLLRDVFAFARHNKAWWIVPMVIILLLIAMLIVATQTAAPSIYSFV